MACLLLAGLTVTPVTQAVQPSQGEALQAITDAQTALNAAFKEVMLADLARAPISDLVAALNDAIATLGQARAAFNATDYASAVTFAANAETAADAIGTQALNRRAEANLQGALQILAVVGGVVITVAVAYLLLTRWRRYQQQRRRDLLRTEIRLPDRPKEEEKNHE